MRGQFGMKVPLNLSIEESVAKEFKAKVERVGLSISGGVEVFMRGMLSDESLKRMKKFIRLTNSSEKKRGTIFPYNFTNFIACGCALHACAERNGYGRFAFELAGYV
jgi:hypothetical protein